MINKIKLVSILVLFIMSVLAISSVVSALPLTINRVRVDGEPMGDGINVMDIEKDQEIEVKVTITGYDNTTSNTTIESPEFPASVIFESIRFVISGCTKFSRIFLDSSFFIMMLRSIGRFMAPSLFNMSLPKKSTIFRWATDPETTASLARESVSITVRPNSLKRRQREDFPEPALPVIATFIGSNRFVFCMDSCAFVLFRNFPRGGIQS